MELVKCLHCKQKPKLVEIHGMYYAQCSCGAWNPYEFVGVKKITAIAQWNIYNCIPNSQIREISNIRNKITYYKYYINDTEVSLDQAANLTNTTKHYIMTRFKKGKVSLNFVVIKGVKIERKEKRKTYV